MAAWFKKYVNLQYKLNFFIYLGIFILLLNFPVLYLGVTNVNQGIRDLELTEDLYNTILEMRRYEKNFLLYHNEEALESTRYYLDLATKSFSKKLSYWGKSRSRIGSIQLERGLKEYAALDMLNATQGSKNPDKSAQEEIRSVGKQLVDAAQLLLKAERGHIANEAKNGKTK